MMPCRLCQFTLTMTDDNNVLLWLPLLHADIPGLTSIRRYVGPTIKQHSSLLFYCWANVADVGPTLKQHSFTVLCLADEYCASFVTDMFTINYFLSIMITRKCTSQIGLRPNWVIGGWVRRGDHGIISHLTESRILILLTT